jgi:hypothetical protein
MSTIGIAPVRPRGLRVPTGRDVDAFAAIEPGWLNREIEDSNMNR